MLALLREVLPADRQGLLLDIADQLVLSVGSPRRVAMQYLVEDESQRPYVAFGSVILALEYF